MNGIYTITNLIDGKSYVGQSSYDYKKRFIDHRFLLKKGKHSNIHLQRAWNKYGSENFEFKVIIQDIPEDWLDLSERGWILFHKMTTGCYNLESGGHMSKHASEETKQKLRISHLGKKSSEETRKKISDALTGKKCSEETRHKLSLANAGRRPAEAAIQAAATYHRGKKLSQEHRNNISKALLGDPRLRSNLGKHHSEEQKRKISEANKGRPSPMKGKVGPMFGRHHTASTLHKLRVAALGRQQSTETRNKHSVALKLWHANKRATAIVAA